MELEQKARIHVDKIWSTEGTDISEFNIPLTSVIGMMVGFHKAQEDPEDRELLKACSEYLTDYMDGNQIYGSGVHSTIEKLEKKLKAHGLGEIGTTYIAELEAKNKALRDALETAVVGLQWWNESHPESSSRTDDENIANFKKLLK